MRQCYSVYAGGNQVRPPAREPSCQVDGKKELGGNELRVCKLVMRLTRNWNALSYSRSVQVDLS